MSIYSNFDQASLDREYSPSSCVDDIDIYVEEYLNVSRKAKETAIAQGSCLSDLAYGSSDDEVLDLFLPASTNGAPLHIYIHGGYWQALSKNDSSFAAPMFQQHGSFFAALNYSLAPAVSLTEIVAQNRRAIAWLYHQSVRWGFDREKLFLSGSSAGAQLVMMMLTTDWTHYELPQDAIKGVCAVSGLYDLEPIRLSYVNELLHMDGGEARANSPLFQDIRNRAPVIFAHGDNETSEFKRQTNDYKEQLIKSGESVCFKEIKNRNHFNVIMDLCDTESWIAQQVLQQMGLR